MNTKRLKDVFEKRLGPRAKKYGLSKIVAVETCLNDQLRREGLNFKTEVRAS